MQPRVPRPSGRSLSSNATNFEQAGIPDVPTPKTLAALLDDFFAEHAEKKLAQKP